MSSNFDESYVDEEGFIYDREGNVIGAKPTVIRTPDAVYSKYPTKFALKKKREQLQQQQQQQMSQQSGGVSSGQRSQEDDVYSYFFGG